MRVSALLREMRESAPAELEGRLVRLEDHLFRLRLRHATNQLEKSDQIRATRREIARVATVLAERRKGTK